MNENHPKKTFLFIYFEKKVRTHLLPCRYVKLEHLRQRTQHKQPSIPDDWKTDWLQNDLKPMNTRNDIESWHLELKEKTENPPFAPNQRFGPFFSSSNRYQKKKVSFSKKKKKPHF